MTPEEAAVIDAAKRWRTVSGGYDATDTACIELTKVVDALVSPDIVTRLRTESEENTLECYDRACALMSEAADEIERLRVPHDTKAYREKVFASMIFMRDKSAAVWYKNAVNDLINAISEIQL